MRTLNYFLADASNHKARAQQWDFIGEFIQANLKHRVLLSWTADMDNNYQNMATILEYH